MPSTFTLLKSTEGHYALYDDGELVSTWVPLSKRRYNLREYIDKQIDIRKGINDKVVEGEGTYPWSQTLKKESKPAPKTSKTTE